MRYFDLETDEFSRRAEFYDISIKFKHIRVVDK